MIEYRTPARVGLLGSPSDGYGGRTLGLAVHDFSATVSLAPADGIILRPAPSDRLEYDCIESFVDHVDRFGFGTGVQLLAASCRTFFDVLDSLGAAACDGFALHYETTIPRQVGLAGSSAIVISTLRCLAEHAGIELPSMVLPSIALRVETEQLGMTAGLQDRVVQTLGGLVAMDFATMTTDARFGVAHGEYEQLDVAALPPLFLAYREAAAEPSEVYHGTLRARFDAGESLVRDTMHRLAALVIEGRASLRWGDHDRFGQLVNENMELRRGLGPLPPHQVELVELASSLGAPSTFAGSGGAIVGVHNGDDHLARLTAGFARLDAEVVAVTPQPPTPADPTPHPCRRGVRTDCV